VPLRYLKFGVRFLVDYEINGRSTPFAFFARSNDPKSTDSRKEKGSCLNPEAYGFS
jgi:hypothetical protein